MENILVAVFNNESQAREASHALEALGEVDTIGLNAAAIVTKAPGGAISVTRTHRPARGGTLGSTAVGTFIGMLSGGVGLIIGAATGLALGASAAVFDKKVRRDFLADVERALEPGKSAVLAQIEEQETAPVNERMAALGGVVFRRALTDVENQEHAKKRPRSKPRLRGGHHV
jgi:uncharacterized membrane protein